ncbi:hypothetical protein FRZ44_21030 [Hypericibacter terrae]|uniref:AMP-dependent synthetase/ligase domain-containing protein n=2 Tax=Hypericibacter terrae TaxID=2602015 RepID=A0A5J6MH24_9PROT|nr:hypothetical protein FRZ44_21030 [Hypericibacter terrae]
MKPLLEFPTAWAARRAMASGLGHLTYAEMREGMLRCSRFLRERHGVLPGDRIAFCLPKSLEAIQVILGILAAGAAYVPLQFQGPAARLNSILRSTEPKLLMTTPQMADQLAAEGGWPGFPVCRLTAAEAGQGLATLLSGMPPDAEPLPLSPESLAAIYFTSGSTGEPKGVMLSQGNIAAGVELVVKSDVLDDRDRMLSHTNLHYAAYDMFFPFAAGAQIFLLSDREAMIPAGVAGAVERERVTVWRSTITALRLLLESGELGSRDLRSLRMLGVFGESFPIPLLRQLMAALPTCRFKFNYGATEVYRITSFEIPQNLPDDLVSLPIGPDRPEYAISLRDDADREVENGAVGELCVEGAPVMLGYWKDPELTARRRLSGRPHSWRSGDFAYRDAAGLLHLVGRQDQMIKIRGHRFDLGEIEAVLRSQPGVRDAVAALVAKADGNAEVHAALLAEPSETIKTAVRLACAKRLPAFARPSRLLTFEQFPLLPSGKVDRMTLQAKLREAG